MLSRLRLAALAVFSILTMAATAAGLSSPAGAPPGERSAGIAASGARPSAHIPTFGEGESLELVVAADRYFCEQLAQRVAVRTELVYADAPFDPYPVSDRDLDRCAPDTRAAVSASISTQVEYQHARGLADWDGIARCETGSNWAHQTAYDGGLGILHAAWVEFGGRQFAEYGSQATHEQQIIVAGRIHARYGLSGWGCKAYG